MRDHQRIIEVAANALRAESDPRERFDALPSLVGLEALSHLDGQCRFNGQMALSFAAVALAGGGLLVPALADIGPAALAWAVVAALFALTAFAVARAVAWWSAMRTSRILAAHLIVRRLQRENTAAGIAPSVARHAEKSLARRKYERPAR